MGPTDFLVNATFQSSAYEISRKMVGMPVNAFFGFVTDGVFQNEGEIAQHHNADGLALQPDAKPGDLRWIDLNEDGVINAKDRAYLGDPTPHWTSTPGTRRSSAIGPISASTTMWCASLRAPCGPPTAPATK